MSDSFHWYGSQIFLILPLKIKKKNYVQISKQPRKQNNDQKWPLEVTSKFRIL